MDTRGQKGRGEGGQVRDAAVIWHYDKCVVQWLKRNLFTKVWAGESKVRQCANRNESRGTVTAQHSTAWMIDRIIT